VTERRGPRPEHGASLVEYVLLIALIAIVALLSVRFFGSSRDNSLSKSGSALGGIVRPMPLSQTQP
jgi:Flp pilus assembly pilin Flp